MAGRRSSDPLSPQERANEATFGVAVRDVNTMLKAMGDLKRWEESGHLALAVVRLESVITDAEKSLTGLRRGLASAVATAEVPSDPEVPDAP
ncbi:hypothetical protein SAMN05444157_1591 [Frankineae bacterium MT45]|nr:hypothetical protein SAMN05444157_1591 [Frankineae bacterium MT45]